MSFRDEDLTEDGFLGGRLRILQPRDGYRAAGDPVFLAAAVPARPGDRVLELGCGAGVASLCLAVRVPGVLLAGLERQADYADLARRNGALNGLAFQVEDGDLAQMPAGLRAKSFDHVIANPPFYAADGGTSARDPGREAALREATPLALWVGAGLRRLVPGGWLTMVLSADRLPDLLAAMGDQAGSIAVLPLASRVGRSANRVILRARKGGRGRFVLLAPFVLHGGEAHDTDRDSFTQPARAILRDGAVLEGFEASGVAP